MLESIPKFLQGVFTFQGQGYETPAPLHETLAYTVPADRRTQLIYLRAGNSADALIYLVLTRDGRPMRYFPIGGGASVHVPLAVVEDLFPDTRLSVLVGAPAGICGTVILDLGMVEI